MNLLYVAAAVLVVAGGSLAFALLWLRRLARRQHVVLDELLRLRESIERDTPAALPVIGAWAVRAGITSLAWEGEWYGAQVAGHAGPPMGTRSRLEREFRTADVHLRLQVGFARRRGEARLFAEQAADWLFLVLDGALASRELASMAAMAQRARLAVFVQHDMRNLVQWIDLATEDLAQAQTETQLLAAARLLQRGVGPARERASRIVSTMTEGAASFQGARVEELDVEQELATAAVLHQVELAMSTTPCPVLRWDRSALAVVLDNVFGNISKLSRERGQPSACHMQWRVAGGWFELRLSSPQLELELPLERVFEPWAATSGNGLGIGMYQARKAATGAGGELKAERIGNGLCVVLGVKV